MLDLIEKLVFAGAEIQISVVERVPEHHSWWLVPIRPPTLMVCPDLDKKIRALLKTGGNADGFMALLRGQAVEGLDGGA